MRQARGGGRRSLEAEGLSREQISRLDAWLSLLQDWNRRVNLTGLRCSEEMIEHLVMPVLAVRELAREGLLDIGSGNGSPGLVWAALRPDIEVTLLEPRLKRWAFLREAVRAIGRSDIVVLRERHDEYRGPAVRTISVRALALPLASISPLAPIGGRLIIFGAAPVPDPHWQALAAPRPGVHVLERRA